MLRKLTFILLILFVTTQCALEKRLYNKGYSVSWNKKLHGSRNQVQEEMFEAKQHNIYAQTDSISDLSGIMPLVGDAVVDSDSEPLNDESAVIVGKPMTNYADTVYVDHYYVPSGVASFGFLIGAVAATFAGVFFYFEFLFIAVAALFLISFVLGIISAVQFRNNRNLYASNTFGIIALVIDSMLLLLFLFLLTLLFIYFN